MSEIKKENHKLSVIKTGDQRSPDTSYTDYLKEDAKEVASGNECGMLIDGYDDIKEGDVLECYLTQEVRRTLD